MLLGVRLLPHEYERLRERCGGKPVGSVVRDLIREWIEGGPLGERVRAEAERVRADREKVLRLLSEVRALRGRTRNEIGRLRGRRPKGRG